MYGPPGGGDAGNGRLLAAAAQGDAAAWASLVARYNGLLWSITRAFRLSIADGGDAVQNSWLRLVENLDRITDPDRLGSWLATTTRRECLMMLRRRSREPVVGGADWLLDVPEPAEPVDAALLLAERDAALWKALLTLPERCQQLLRLLMSSPPPSYADVGATLSMPVGTIGPTRQRCLDRLRTLVAQDELLAGPAVATEEP